jgi:hypothetical protein
MRQGSLEAASDNAVRKINVNPAFTRHSILTLFLNSIGSSVFVKDTHFSLLCRQLIFKN